MVKVTNCDNLSVKQSRAFPVAVLQNGPKNVVDKMEDNKNRADLQAQSAAKRHRPIYSISRLTQMARLRTFEMLSTNNCQQSQEDGVFRSPTRSVGEEFSITTASNRHRLKSQSSVMSFASSNQKLRGLDLESDRFLRRFAVNSSDELQSESFKSTQNSIFTNILAGTFVIDPAQNFYYHWLSLISLAVCYNIVFIIGRGVFWNLHNIQPTFWYILDYLCDLIYLIDMFANSRTGYLEEGILVNDTKKLFENYFKSYAFKLDLLSVAPTDFAYAFLDSHCLPNRVPCAIIVRLNRLFKFHRLAQFFDRTESKTNFPFVFRISKLVFYILVIIHWNACIYFAISYMIGFGRDNWVYQPLSSGAVSNLNGNLKSERNFNPLPGPLAIPLVHVQEVGVSTVKTITSSMGGLHLDKSGAHRANVDSYHPNIESKEDNDSLVHQYIYCFYWSTLTLTTIGEVPMPERDIEYLFVVIDFLIGLLIFATIVGNIGSMITNMNAARAEFQHKMDSVKQWMKFRRVNKELEVRIIKWFDYLWANRQTLDEESVTAILPDRLKAETAIHVHLETLKRVQLFKDCEPGLLVQLVLKLKLQVFSPGDYICRVGDVGKEMYIVKRGELSVLAEDCKTIYGKLSAGSVFGELSILNISGVKTGNRRTANVRSVGFSDLFALSKQDLWNVLEDYPDAKSVLVEKGKHILRKDGLLSTNDASSQIEPESTSCVNTSVASNLHQQCSNQPSTLEQRQHHNQNALIFNSKQRTPSLYGLAGDGTSQTLNASETSLLIEASQAVNSNAGIQSKGLLARSSCNSSFRHRFNAATNVRRNSNSQALPMVSERIRRGIVPAKEAFDGDCSVPTSPFLNEKVLKKIPSTVTDQFSPLVAQAMTSSQTIPIKKRPPMKKSLSFAMDIIEDCGNSHATDRGHEATMSHSGVGNCLAASKLSCKQLSNETVATITGNYNALLQALDDLTRETKQNRDEFKKLLTRLESLMVCGRPNSGSYPNKLSEDTATQKFGRTD